MIPPSPDATGFLVRGRLSRVGEHYLRHADGSYFVKSGTNSPENLLGYAGFDNTVRSEAPFTCGRTPAFASLIVETSVWFACTASGSSVPSNEC